MENALWLIPFLPFAGFLLNGLLGKKLSESLSGLIASATIGASFVLGLLSLNVYMENHETLHQVMFTWLSFGSFDVSVAYTLDALSLVMVLVVTGVGFLIHVYSIGYMKGDPGIQRYFAYLNLFTFMMLNLVMADNLLLLFLGWEGVGLCSYLLIGFWFEDPAKAAAGKKAFVVNRIGDFGFLLGMIIILTNLGSLNFGDILLPEHLGSLEAGLITTIALLLFLGAAGKSAQIPLYVWLPDAMAGPTPVSALIHAATMVTAGVYLVARMGALFALSATALSVMAVIGVLTAFFAATMAIYENDIKKVLAYSTISQLGYMFAAAGVGAYGAAIFHLMTHAFFKGLLFLGAGSVIHGLSGEQDMRRMGGLKSKMPKTYWTMLAGVSAISGLPLLSGFFSKDEILWFTYSSQSGGNFIFIVGLLTAILTAFYMFRLFFLSFHGDSRWTKGITPHESPPVMTVPLILLAVLSVTGGWIGIPEILGGGNSFHHFLSETVHDVVGPHPTDLLLSELTAMVLSITGALVGIYVAFRRYGTGKLDSEPKGFGHLVEKKYYVDELYDAVIVQPIRRGSESIWRRFDVRVIDGIVNGLGSLTLRVSSFVRRAQTGVIQNYAAVILLGVILIIFYVYLK